MQTSEDRLEDFGLSIAEATRSKRLPELTIGVICCNAVNRIGAQLSKHRPLWLHDIVEALRVQATQAIEASHPGVIDRHWFPFTKLMDLMQGHDRHRLAGGAQPHLMQSPCLTLAVGWTGPLAMVASHLTTGKGEGKRSFPRDP